MASKKDYAPQWPQNKRIPHKHVDFGSPEHAALVGLPDEATAEAMDPKERAARQRVLEAEPVVACPETKVPINKRNFLDDDEILDGWKRYATGTR